MGGAAQRGSEEGGGVVPEEVKIGEGGGWKWRAMGRIRISVNYRVIPEYFNYLLRSPG